MVGEAHPKALGDLPPLLWEMVEILGWIVNGNIECGGKGEEFVQRRRHTLRMCAGLGSGRRVWGEALIP